MNDLHRNWLRIWKCDEILLTRCELTRPLFPKLSLHDISATDPNSPSFESLTAFPLDSAELFVGVYVLYSKC